MKQNKTSIQQLVKIANFYKLKNNETWKPNRSFRLSSCSEKTCWEAEEDSSNERRGRRVQAKADESHGSEGCQSSDDEELVAWRSI